LSQVDINKKYNNFLTPKNQIIVNSEDILEKYGVQTSAITVEEIIGVLPKFYFVVNNPQLLRKSTELFDLKKNVLIKMGYANTLETVVEGEIAETKSIFPSNGPPRIEVYGQAKIITKTTPSTNNKPIFTLTYGSTLFSFISIASIQEQDNKTASITRATAAKASTTNLHCSAECVGVPELKAQTLVSVAGIGNAYDGNYYVKKVTHELSQSGYATKFEAETLLKRMLLQPKI
jgi:hypothetical protein